MRDINAAAEHLMFADDERLALLVKRDPDMIRDVANWFRVLVRTVQPFAEKATLWEKNHPIRLRDHPRRDSVQIQHRLGDFRAVRRLLNEIEAKP